MFYNQCDIDHKLVCLLCVKRFEIPKMLPCTYHICANCEKGIYDRTKANFQCPICNQQHETPTDELPVSSLMKTLLECNPIQVYRGDVYKNGQENLDVLGNLIKNIDRNTRIQK